MASHERRATFFLAYPDVLGGIENTTKLLCKGLEQRDWRVEVILPAHGLVEAMFQDSGIPVVVIGAPQALAVYGRRTTGLRSVAAIAALPSYWVRLAEHFRRRSSLVHAGAQRAMILSGPAARMGRVPFVWQLHSTEGPALINRGGEILAKQVVAVSRAAVAGTPGISARHARIVPNALDPRFWSAPAPGADSRPTIACVSRISPEKGLDILLKASLIVREMIPELRVVIIGGGQVGHDDYWQELQTFVHIHRLDSTVEFAGLQKRPEVLLSTAWVYAQPSLKEGFGIATLEAMALGLPVVASRVGGLAELVVDGETGVLVPPGDPSTLAIRLSELLSSPAKRSAIGVAAQASVLGRFDVAGMALAMDDIYRHVLSSRTVA